MLMSSSISLGSLISQLPWEMGLHYLLPYLIGKIPFYNDGSLLVLGGWGSLISTSANINKLYAFWFNMSWAIEKQIFFYFPAA